MIDDMVALWTWPLQAVRLGANLLETWIGAQQVVTARLPVIAAAAVNPIGADHAELGRMVSEKVDAFGRSGRTLDAAGARMRATSSANARTLGRMAGGSLLWPSDWLRLFKNNLATAAALATLPTRALNPIHAGVTANTKRLRQRR